MKKVFSLLVLLLFSTYSFAQFEEYRQKLGVIDNIQEYDSIVRLNPYNKLVDIEQSIPKIVLDIKYATKNNFTKEVIYDSPRAFLSREAADALLLVQLDLNRQGYGLKVFDAYRPYSATVKFYEIYPDSTYVESPKTGSVHNRACAVDLTIIKLETGYKLPMPTQFDDFSERASHDFRGVPEKIAKNRKLLKDVMAKYGFLAVKSKWWHYNFKTWKRHPLMDIKFEDVK